MVGFEDEADSAAVSGDGDNCGLGVAEAVAPGAASLVAVLDEVDDVDGVDEVDWAREIGEKTNSMAAANRRCFIV